MDITQGDPSVMAKLAPGRIDVIENKDRKEGEPEAWLRIMLLPEDKHKVIQAFFTKDEVLAAVARVKENREDIADPAQPRTALDKMQKAVNGFFDRIQK